ncbi:MAG: Rsd/AlgQ family anti-sigma factor [Pseudomonadota bacterium]
MAKQCSDPLQQFGMVEELLTRWLGERRELLTRYTRVAVIIEAETDSTLLSSLQKTLCEILVDYVSAGHFEVYSELLEEAARFADGSDMVAANLIPDISDTTEVILAYEEKYSGGEAFPATQSRDLSALGEILESRFQLEDRLIAALHGRHRAAATIAETG